MAEDQNPVRPAPTGFPVGPEPHLAMPATAQPPKHGRASRACLRCRGRKVRCDATRKRGKCTNCSLDGTRCEFVRQSQHTRESSANPSWPHDKQANLRQHTAAVAGQSQLRHSRNVGPEHVQNDLQTIWDVAASDDIATLMSGPDLDIFNASQLEQPPLQQPLERQAEDADSDRQQSHSPSDTVNPRDISHSHNARLVANDKPDSNTTTVLPDFIEAFSVNHVDDVDYLRRKGVFTFPPKPLQLAILNQYADFVHPLLPVIDLAEFRSILGGIMFAGVASVDPEVVIRQSYMSKLAARGAYYERAKTLFDMDIEKDKTTICQASLLLLGWVKENNPKDATYWLGNAITQAYFLNLDKDKPQLSTISHSRSRHDRNRRRILWWCVLMKECDLCMYTGQYPRVWPSAPTLTLSDFGFNDTDINMAADNSSHESQGERLKHALVCVEKAKLCRHIYLILQHIFHDAVAWGWTGSGTTLPALRQYMLRDLRQWHSEIPDTLRWDTLLAGVPYGASRGAAWAMSVIELIYWGAHFVIYKDNMTRDVYARIRVQQTTEHSPQTEWHSFLIRQAGYETTAVLEQLLNHDLHGALPPSALTNIYLATSALLLDFNNPDSEIRKRSIAQVDVCIKCSLPLADHGPILRDVVNMLQDSRKAVLGRSLQSSSSTSHSAQNPVKRNAIMADALDEDNEKMGQQNAAAAAATALDPTSDRVPDISANPFSTSEWYSDGDLGFAENLLSAFDYSGYTWA
ncbi:hypothetical protein AYO20_02088 [Fonsecaea nubica]|uniref:Zn(2)-C6 fungal-type domain-containing protein n=1 Tax=Fonsecaea nubica TaxID=856822 RepID=A0A178D8G0_9EURO|nr:hypothetical protein AYO20_02088 [Fonsecaea nubica]OAL38439.1 hypothetical protein AYO20_02088 [Fonsecaea nubica]